MFALLKNLSLQLDYSPTGDGILFPHHMLHSIYLFLDIDTAK
jgi:hypothetical protein